MRMLFNHGLTPAELYVNTPTSITDRKWRWFISKYGSTSSYSDALSLPFKYCFALVLNKVLDEKMRFKVPVKSEAYIDYEVVSGSLFEQHRQNGRFQDIDFIGSNFTGYTLRYYFKAKAYQKSYQIYLGSELKQKFLDGINSGEEYYTIKDFGINDIIDEVHEKFQDLTKDEVKKLVCHGFRRMHSAIKFGCAITINSTRFINCYAYIGTITKVPEKQIKEYSIKRDRKLRKIEGWKKTPFDGYYYIALNKTAIKKWMEENAVSRTLIKFTDVIPRKIQGELYYKYRESYVFRIKLKKFRGWAFWADSLTCRDVEYMGSVNNLVFTPDEKTWKEFRKEYDETVCE